MSDEWRAMLISSFTQAGKTWKCLQILAESILHHNLKKTLVLFVTQANCTTSAHQVIQRAKNHMDLLQRVPSEHIFRTCDIPDPKSLQPGCYMVVDFWNAKCMQLMHDFVVATAYKWNNIIVVIDEVDQAGSCGVSSRMQFVDNIENVCGTSKVQAILITASVANLSKCMCKLATNSLQPFPSGSLVHDIVHEKVVKHEFAEPHPNYVGPSWFIENNTWIRLQFPPKSKDMSTDDYKELQETTILKHLNALTPEQKTLTLVVTSTKTSDHRMLAHQLFSVGYNVVVELNGKNNRDYTVLFLNTDQEVQEWLIPYQSIESAANRGDLEDFDHNDAILSSGIHSMNDLTLGHILQSALFMKTDRMQLIRRHVCDQEFFKLQAVSNRIANLHRTKKRPSQYPSHPRVALVAGHLAGRGISIQNPYIDFVCTSFLFTDSKDVVQRGATNCQRFGRACGMMKEIFGVEGRSPVLIATEAIIKDAVANQAILKDNMDESMICLKDFVSKDDWNKIVKQSNQTIQEYVTPPKPKITIKRPENSKCPLKKNGFRDSPSQDAILVTEYKRFTQSEFIGLYNLQNLSLQEPQKISEHLRSQNIDAHVSIALISAKTVADISNVFRNPTWCYKPYHVIMQNESVVMIKRDIAKIKHIRHSEHQHILAHTPDGMLQSYIVDK